MVGTSSLFKLNFIHFRQSINDLSTKHHHAKSTSNHIRERVSSVTSDKDVKKEAMKHNLIEEETVESGKVRTGNGKYYCKQYSLLPL
jgi:hypothetical protein